MIALERRAGRPLRIGHRGAAALAPENTLGSFRAAIEVGVDLVEFDVLGLTSGDLVVAHSNDLHEVSHGAARGSVRDRSLAELREVCPDLLTLAEALEFFAVEAIDVGVHVDLKQRHAAATVASELARFGLTGRSLVSSFHWSSLRQVRRRAPALRTGASFPQDRLRINDRPGAEWVIRPALAAARLVLPVFAGSLLSASRTATLALHHSVVSRSVVARAHRRGAAVIAWTVDEHADLERVDRAGVDAVVSNDPRIFLSTLAP